MTGSLQFRLAWRLALVFSVVILATSFAILVHRGSGNTDIPRDELTEAIDQVRGGLSLGGDGKPRLDLPADPGFAYAVDTADGRPLFASAKAPLAVPSSWSVGFLRRGDETLGLREVDSPIGRVAIRVGMDIRGAQGWVAGAGPGARRGIAAGAAADPAGRAHHRRPDPARRSQAPAASRPGGGRDHARR